MKYGILSSSSCDNCNLTPTSSDLVANVGPGYEILDFGAGNLAIEGEYESGITNVNSSGTPNVTTNGWGINFLVNIAL